MKILKIGILSILLTLAVSVSSQELSYGYYNYIMNRFNMNPAFAGNNGNITAMLNTKTYMAGFSDAPRNTMFGIHAPITSAQGIGGRIISDKRGAYELTKYDLTYSYQIRFDEKSDLRFGISAGALRRMLNPNNISGSEFLNQADPTLGDGFYDETRFIAGVGLVYDYDKLQIGLSAPSLVVGGEEISQHIVATASYLYNINNSDFAISPIVIYQNLPIIDNRYDILLKGEFKEKIWAQVGYQSTNNLNFGIGFDLGPFGVGYSYEMNNSEINDIASSSNEIMITIGFASQKMKERDATLETLDNYVAKLNKMMADNQNTYSRGDVMTEIQKIRMELTGLEKQNNKKKAKEVEKRLLTIENQIIELEKKYAR